ncbi:MAG TPA: tRNA pseudouridine(38-40) synthase TruA [Verrucomicrobiae bacterium]|nr:tRNA pseudouridine(38-40) synthase TruA [Verrucomicrobiae bacterium]
MNPAVSHSSPQGDVVQRRFRLTIAYDGTHYEGWQVQKIGRGVQAILEQAIARIFSHPHRVHSSSRTDTGVHALAMVAHFDVPAAECRIDPRKLVLALNAHLPDDIRVTAASLAKRNFHARFDASGKEYRYFVWNHAAMNPLLRHHAWHVPKPLDFNAMKSAAQLFVGRHDFQSFSSNPGYKKESTVRTVTHCQVRRRGPQVIFTIRGDGFLYKMCRGIAGTLVQVGLGKFVAADIEMMLRKADRRVAGMTAPAHGLVLWKVFYDRHRKSARAKSES